MVMKKSDDPAESANGTNGTMTMVEAVRTCLAEAPDLSPSDAVVRIKERFGMDIDTAVFSTYRCQIRARQEGRQPGQRGKPPATGATIRNPLAAVQAVKAVSDKHGIAVMRDVLVLVEGYDVATLVDVLTIIDGASPVRVKDRRARRKEVKTPAGVGDAGMVGTGTRTM
jgi:hypothetical protein